MVLTAVRFRSVRLVLPVEARLFVMLFLEQAGGRLRKICRGVPFGMGSCRMSEGDEKFGHPELGEHLKGNCRLARLAWEV